MIEHELARSVLLEHSLKVNSPEFRFRKEWESRRAAEESLHEIEPTNHPVDIFLKGKELDRAA